MDVLRLMGVTYRPCEDLEAFVPPSVPASWSRIDWPVPAWNCAGVGPLRGLRVMLDAGTEEDGAVWLHVSASRRGRCPSWEDMSAVKRLFVGERVAYQVHPPQSEHTDG